MTLEQPLWMETSLEACFSHVSTSAIVLKNENIAMGKLKKCKSNSFSLSRYSAVIINPLFPFLGASPRLFRSKGILRISKYNPKL
jgi:hypothetical protein